MPRDVFLDRNAVTRGVTFNIPMGSVDLRRIGGTLALTGLDRLIDRLPRNVGAGMNRHKMGLSKKRHRHVKVTHTLCRRTRILIFSRTADTLSNVARGVIVSTVRRFDNGGAVVVVTRHLGAMRGYSLVCFVRRKGVMSYNACRSLMIHGSGFGRVSGRTWQSW